MPVLDVCYLKQYAGAALPGTGSSGGGSGQQATIAVSMSASKNGGTFEKGDSSLTNIKFTITVTEVNPSRYPITSLKLYNNGTVINTFTPVSGQRTYEYTVPSITTNSSIKVEAKTSVDTATKTIVYNFVDAMYYGVQLNFPTEVELKSMTKKISGKGPTSLTYTTDDSCCIFAYPASYGNLTSITDALNFEYINAFENTELDITTPAGETVTYKVYKSDQATISDFKYNFKW